MIVIDDGSSDRTLELLDSVTDERLKIFSYENGGVSVRLAIVVSLMPLENLLPFLMPMIYGHPISWNCN